MLLNRGGNQLLSSMVLNWCCSTISDSSVKSFELKDGKGVLTEGKATFFLPGHALDLKNVHDTVRTVGSYVMYRRKLWGQESFHDSAKRH